MAVSFLSNKWFYQQTDAYCPFTQKNFQIYFYFIQISLMKQIPKKENAGD